MVRGRIDEQKLSNWVNTERTKDKRRRLGARSPSENNIFGQQKKKSDISANKARERHQHRATVKPKDPQRKMCVAMQFLKKRRKKYHQINKKKEGECNRKQTNKHHKLAHRCTALFRGSGARLRKVHPTRQPSEHAVTPCAERKLARATNTLPANKHKQTKTKGLRFGGLFSVKECVNREAAFPGRLSFPYRCVLQQPFPILRWVTVRRHPSIR